jgi:hypothetical protein
MESIEKLCLLNQRHFVEPCPPNVHSVESWMKIGGSKASVAYKDLPHLRILTCSRMYAEDHENEIPRVIEHVV